MRWLLIVLLVAILLVWWQFSVHMSTQGSPVRDGVPARTVLWMMNTSVCPSGYRMMPLASCHLPSDSPQIVPILFCLKES
jgi:hypothetical protein